MKFSYTLLKKLVPEIKSKKDLIERMNLYVFETEDAGGDTLEISVSPNRFSSAGGHWGMATEIAAVYGSNFEIRNPKSENRNKFEIRNSKFEILIKTDLCRRIVAQYIENIKIKPSPKWLAKILEDCGFRPINNIVDITNYVMLETGQPLHAFDFDKVAGAQLIVRPAQLPEDIVVLDGQKFHLDQNVLVIADAKNPLDIAGIKGGREAEISERTSRIILTAANFEGAAIYQTSRKLNLITDASVRNSHNLTPYLAGVAMQRAAELITQSAHGQPGKIIDVYPQRPLKKVLKFNVEKFNSLSGLRLKEKEALNYLKKLGFIFKGDSKIEIPPTRNDVETFADLAEEVMRLYGFNNLPAIAPQVALLPSGYEEQVKFKDKVKKVLINFGLNEVYNYSFISKNNLEKSAGEFFGLTNQKIANPLSAEFEYLRPSLAPGLLKNIEDNFRFADEVKIFEVGHIFHPEKIMLGMAVASKKTVGILELKGLAEQLLEQLGLVDYHFSDWNFEIPFLNARESLRIETDHQVIGYIGSVRSSGGKLAVAEIDLEKLLQMAIAEKEYEPLSIYPAIDRDISFLAPKYLRVEEVMSLIENTAPKYLDDVDLIDFFEDEKMLGENMKSLTFRMVFLADDRTLTDKEVDEEVKKITDALESQLGVEIR